MFQKKWKCKLCGSIVKESIPESDGKIIALKILNDDLYAKKNIHFCSEEKIGILELIGAERV